MKQETAVYPPQRNLVAYFSACFSNVNLGFILVWCICPPGCASAFLGYHSILAQQSALGWGQYKLIIMSSLSNHEDNDNNWFFPNSLTLTLLLTMATQIHGMSQNLPQVPYAKAIDTWTGFCLSFGALAILETAVVAYSLQQKQNQIGNLIPGRYIEDTSLRFSICYIHASNFSCLLSSQRN